MAYKFHQKNRLQYTKMPNFFFIKAQVWHSENKILALSALFSRKISTFFPFVHAQKVLNHKVQLKPVPITIYVLHCRPPSINISLSICNEISKYFLHSDTCPSSNRYVSQFTPYTEPFTKQSHCCKTNTIADPPGNCRWPASIYKAEK